MQSLFDELQTTSIKQYTHNRIRTRETLLARDERLKEAVRDFADEIVKDCVSKMKEASEQGLFSCCIFECQYDEMFSDEFRKAFLLRGPFNWTNVIPFFELKNTQSVFDYVSDFVSPIRVHLKYNRSSGSHIIMASWKTR